MKTLFDFYFTIRDRPGWLADCVESGFENSDLECLEKLAVEFESYAPHDQALAWEREIESEGGYDAYFSASDEEKIKALSESIARIYRRYEESIANDEPYLDRAVALAVSNIERLKRLRRNIRGRQLHKTESEKTPRKNEITDSDIERARRYPLEKLIQYLEMARAGRILCRWHSDKNPSMLVKDGFGYCFSCQKSVDALGWMMEIENLGFVEAVKRLNNIL